MFFNISFDSSVNGAPAGFVSTFDAAVAFLSSNFTDNITINVNVGFGEIAGSSLGAGDLGESEWNLNHYSYATIKSALVSDAKSSDDATSLNALPLSEPGNWWVTTAEAKALGLSGPSSNSDGSVGFSSSASFDYDRSDGITAGQYDFFATVVHELTEVMGRALLVGGNIGSTPNSYLPLDLFHFSGPNTHLFVGSSPGYFSVDNGNTDLDNFNTNPGGDFGDWAASAGANSFLAFSNSGVIDAVTEADLRALDVIGYDRVQSTQPINGDDGNNQIIGTAGADTIYGFGGDDTITGNDGSDLIYGMMGNDLIYGNIGVDTLFGGQNDDVLFGGQSNDVIYGNLGNDIIYGNLGNDSLFGGQGADKLFGGQGNDTLVGGLGNDTLVGGLGADLFVIGPNAGNDVIADFHVNEGDRVSVSGQTHTISAAPDGWALILLSGGGTVELVGVTPTAVNDSYFV